MPKTRGIEFLSLFDNTCDTFSPFLFVFAFIDGNTSIWTRSGRYGRKGFYLPLLHIKFMCTLGGFGLLPLNAVWDNKKTLRIVRRVGKPYSCKSVAVPFNRLHWRLATSISSTYAQPRLDGVSTLIYSRLVYQQGLGVSISPRGDWIKTSTRFPCDARCCIRRCRGGAAGSSD